MAGHRRPKLKRRATNTIHTSVRSSNAQLSSVRFCGMWNTGVHSAFLRIDFRQCAGYKVDQQNDQYVDSCPKWEDSPWQDGSDAISVCKSSPSTILAIKSKSSIQFDHAISWWVSFSSRLLSPRQRTSRKHLLQTERSDDGEAPREPYLPSSHFLIVHLFP